MKQPLSADRAGHSTGRVFLPCLMAVALAATDGHAAATIGAGVLKFNASGEVMWDSNVFGNTTDQSDEVFTFQPQVVYDREAAVAQTHFDAGVGFQRYREFSEQNSENWSVNGSITMPEDVGGRLTGNARLTYFNGAESDEFLGRRADINRLSLQINSSYLVSGRTSLRFGFTHSSYDTDIRPDSNSTALRGGVSLQLRHALSGFLDFTRTRTETDAPPGSPTVVDFTSNQLSVGLQGQLNAVWSGSVSVGYQNLSAASDDTGGDSDGLVANVALNWAMRQNTTVSFSGGRSTRVTANADAIDATTASINVAQKIGVALSASAGLVWETFEIRGLGAGNDDRISANVSLNYSINDRFGCGAGVTHNVRESANPLLDITRTTVSAFVRVTF